MKELLSLIIIVVIAIIVIRLIIKITSFLTKLILWIILFLIGVYVLNYYVLPKLGKNPLPFKEQIVNKILKNKKLKQDVQLQLKKTLQHTKPKVEQMLKDTITKDALQKLTTGFITK